MAQVELARGEQEVHAGGEEEEEPGHDQQVQIVVVDAEERQQQEEAADARARPRAPAHRGTLFLPKSPCGRHRSRMMIRTKPMASL